MILSVYLPWKRLLPIAVLFGVTACDDETSTDPTTNTGPLLSEIELSHDDLVPEGISYDAQTRSFLISSLNGGSITRVDATSGAETELVPSTTGGTTIGLHVDSPTRRLWVCAETDVVVYDADTGTELERFDLDEAEGNATCNDLVLVSGGAYVTDSALPNIYRLSPGETATVFATSTEFESTLLGLNGIELTEDGASLVVGRFSPPAVFRVSLEDPTDILEVRTERDTLRSPDGLVTLDGDLYSVTNDAVQKLAFDAPTLVTVTTTNPVDEGLSTGTRAEGDLYIIQSDVTNWVVSELTAMEYEPNLPYRILRVDLGSF